MEVVVFSASFYDFVNAIFVVSYVHYVFRSQLHTYMCVFKFATYLVRI